MRERKLKCDEESETHYTQYPFQLPLQLAVTTWLPHALCMSIGTGPSTAGPLIICAFVLHESACDEVT